MAGIKEAVATVIAFSLIIVAGSAFGIMVLWFLAVTGRLAEAVLKMIGIL